jgi:two-component system LytT family response regulator
MEKYKCLIADDNVIELATLEFHIKKIDNIEIVGICKTGLEVFQALAEQKVDIVFSDIDMPDLNGIDLLKSIKNAPIFVFITSFADYAVESYNLNVIDFIHKPLTFNRLLKAAHKAFEYIEIKKIIANDYKYKDEYFFIKDANGITKLNYLDVVNIESYGDFSKVYTSNGNISHLVLANLKSIESQLPHDVFIRVHRQHIVNINHLSSIKNGDVILTHDKVIPLSSSFKQNLDNILNRKTITRTT